MFSKQNQGYGAVGWQLSYETLHAGGWHVGECNSQSSRVWGGGGLIATSPQPLSYPTAAADAHARVEQPKRRGRECGVTAVLLPGVGFLLVGVPRVTAVKWDEVKCDTSQIGASFMASGCLPPAGPLPVAVGALNVLGADHAPLPAHACAEQHCFCFVLFMPAVGRHPRRLGQPGIADIQRLKREIRQDALVEARALQRAPWLTMPAPSGGTSAPHDTRSCLGSLPA
ncbi:hypothetical protein HaLaN_26541 [Haematococcus lacustris]|uniref:Uncharacterized protein n=1 Tax=Haematococcus lacustris TaxID=44745 RepID=A0A6A0A6V4_HAELA|nr:hypothetical protein HaLaN_26541 [Haematococcus lacustris]